MSFCPANCLGNMPQLDPANFLLLTATHPHYWHAANYLYFLTLPPRVWPSFPPSLCDLIIIKWSRQTIAFQPDTTVLGQGVNHSQKRLLQIQLSYFRYFMSISTFTCSYSYLSVFWMNNIPELYPMRIIGLTLFWKCTVHIYTHSMKNLRVAFKSGY